VAIVLFFKLIVTATTLAISGLATFAAVQETIRELPLLCPAKAPSYILAYCQLMNDHVSPNSRVAR